MTRRVSASAAALVLCALAVTAGGCKYGAPDGSIYVTFRMTSGFGEKVAVPRVEEHAVPGGKPLSSYLQQRQVRTTPDGKTISSLGILPARAPQRWFIWLDGVAPDDGSAQKLEDSAPRVWLDFHDASAAPAIAAVVGQYPDPFRSGIDGKRTPVRVDCAAGSEDACDTARTQLGFHVSVAGVQLGAPAGTGVLRVVVGPWRAVRKDPAALQIEDGPKESGVYARLDETGRRLDVLDAEGGVARTLGPGTGLVAAVRLGDQPVTWIVTGTDDRGVAAAARALDAGVLVDRLAVATTGERVLSLPAGVAERPLPR